jgi:hypothetical protein
MHWPELSFETWRETYATLHMWTQMAGKVVLEFTPQTNHYWNIAFRVTSTGLTSHLVPYQDRAFLFNFNFLRHRLEIACSDGQVEELALRSVTVAQFYGELLEALARLGIEARIWTQPVEIPNPIRFESDTLHHTYEPAHAENFWRALLAINPVFEAFRADYLGKCSPVHFFWGSFDLAVTRFSGRIAPERPELDRVMKEAYSHEVISHGFWPGNDDVGTTFYCYAAPEPEGFRTADLAPAVYSESFKEFFLPYEVVRASAAPEEMLMNFLQGSYASAADLAAWDRGSLERPPKSGAFAR